MPNKARQTAIGLRLRAQRRLIGLSQEEVAEALKRTRQTVANWELGTVAVTAVQIGLLATLYGVSIDYLVLGMGAIPANNKAKCAECINGGGYLRKVFSEGNDTHEHPCGS